MPELLQVAGVGLALLGAPTIGAILLVGSAVLERSQAGRLRRPRNEQTIRASVEPIKWRIGTSRHPGMLSQIAWRGPLLQFTLVLGEAPIAGVSRIWINGRPRDVNITDSGTVTLTSIEALGEGPGRSNGSRPAMVMDFFLSGTGFDPSTQIPEVWRTTAEGLRWTSDMTMEGLAFVVLYIDSGDNRDWFRAPPEMSFLTTGYKWAPPGATATVITNAAEVRRWWEMEREQEPIDRIEATSYTAAIATCTAADYEIHGTVESTDDPDSLRSAFDFAWDGHVVDFNGALHFLPGVARPRILTIPAADIVELPMIQPTRELSDRANRATMQLQQSRLADWQPQSLPAADDTAAQTRDGGVLVRNYSNVEYVTDPAVGSNLNRRQLIDTQGIRVSLTVPYGVEAAPFRYLSLAPGSILEVDLPGLSGKRFRLVGTGPAEADTLRLQLSEELSTRYTAVGPQVPAVVLPESETPAADDTAAPAGLTLTFTSLLTQGNVVTRVTGGGGTVGEGGGTVPAPTVSTGSITVESERELVASWPELTAEDPAINFHIRVWEGSGMDRILLRSATLDRDELTYRTPYVPAERYEVSLRRVLPPSRRATAVTLSATAPADRTNIP